MPASKAQQKAVSKYMKENYDVYQIRMKKGQKEIIKAHAEARNESVNGFIGRAISEAMERDSADGPQKAAGAPAGMGVVSFPSEILETAQAAADAAGEGLPQFVARAVETQAHRDKVARGLKR